MGLIGWSLRAMPEPPSVTRFDYDLLEGQSLRTPGWPLLAVSPDGRHFVYNTQDGLYLRAMDELEARLIPGTEPLLDSIAFSPDGQSVTYWDISAQLKRISISGGAPVAISDIGGLFGVSWQTDGMIYFGENEGISRVSANGGTPELMIPLEDIGNYGAELLPDGDSVLFSVTRPPDWDAAQIVVQSLSTGERTVLIEGGNDARYVSTGHIIYALGDTLLAVAFDPDTLTVSGGTVPVVQGVMRSTTGQSGLAHYGVSENGTLVYVSGSVVPVTRTLVWVDREGREELIDAPPRAYTSPRISPDGTKVALNPRDQENDIWTWDLVRETLTRLTFDPGQDRIPAWSPDSLRIAWSQEGDGNNGDGLFWRAADGTGPAEQLAQSNGEIYPASFLADATAIVVYGDFTGANSNDDIAIVQLDGGDQTATPLLESTFSERYPEVSPDGRWLAYTSNESGRYEIYVRSFPDVDAGGRWQVSTGGGTQPLWARDGQELFYRNSDAMMAVSIETDPSFVAGNPEIVFEDQFLMINQGGRDYDVSLDGERFLMIKDVEDTSATSQIIVVENWFEELKRLVPTE